MIQIPAPPGMNIQQVASDSEDDDNPNVLKKGPKLEAAIAREKEIEEQQKKQAEERARIREEAADREQFIPFLGGGNNGDNISSDEFLANLGLASMSRPEGFEARLQLAADLREQAKIHFQESQHELASKHWLAAIHCLDFTPRQLDKLKKDERHAVYEACLPIFSNMAIVARKLNDVPSAIMTSNIGLLVAEKVPYSKCKEQRVKLRLQRALARGEQRNFTGARDDAEHVLDLIPGHEDAEKIKTNCDMALRLEKGPKDKRWKGPLTRAIVKKAKPPPNKSSMMASIGPLLRALVSNPICKGLFYLALPVVTASIVFRYPNWEHARRHRPPAPSPVTGISHDMDVPGAS